MKKYLIQGGIGIGLSVLLAFWRFSGWEPCSANFLRAASDGFVVVGFLYLAVAALRKVSSTGFFDIFSYGLREGVEFLIPGMRKEASSFYDYKEEKAEKRSQKEERAGKRAILFTGISLFALGVIFTGLYYAVL
ncbi:MAG: DUF3899 domain-containing protein [Lachnospiraceae bacterium]|nr:DUF3899 domain-containing protein [Lachnospiraceae bacterium]